MIKHIIVGILGIVLFTSIIPVPTVAETLPTNQIASEFLAQEYGQIDIFNQQSYPTKGGPWIVEFTTKGTHDLIVSGINGTTFHGLNPDLSFIKLDSNIIPIIRDGEIIFPNYSSDDLGRFMVQVNTLGPHHLQFEFGSDVAFANNFASGSSNVKIASGTNGGPTLADSDRFGLSVTNIGDLNNDGIEDLAVGAFFDDTGGTDRGAVYVLFMTTSGTVSSSVKIASGTNGGPVLTDGDFFGSSVTNIGDLDNDGIEDLAVGAFFDDTVGADRGAVYILFMATSGSASSTVKISQF